MRRLTTASSAPGSEPQMFTVKPNTSMSSSTTSSPSNHHRRPAGRRLRRSSTTRPPVSTTTSSNYKPLLMASLCRLRSAGSATSDHTRETLAETDETASHSSHVSSSHQPHYYSNNNAGSIYSSSSAGRLSLQQQRPPQQQHFCGAPSSIASSSISSRLHGAAPYYYTTSAAGKQYLPCETERHDDPGDDRVCFTGPVDVDEMVPLVDVVHHRHHDTHHHDDSSRISSGPVDLDELEEEGVLDDDESDDDSTGAMMVLDWDMDETDYEHRLMGYVSGFRPQVIHQLPTPPPPSLLPMANYAARRKFSHDAIPRPIAEERFSKLRHPVAGSSIVSKHQRSQTPATFSSSGSHMTSICHNCGGRSGECMGGTFCI